MVCSLELSSLNAGEGPGLAAGATALARPGPGLLSCGSPVRFPLLGRPDRTRHRPSPVPRERIGEGFGLGGCSLPSSPTFEVIDAAVGCQRGQPAKLQAASVTMSRDRGPERRTPLGRRRQSVFAGRGTRKGDDAVA